MKFYYFLHDKNEDDEIDYDYQTLKHLKLKRKEKKEILCHICNKYYNIKYITRHKQSFKHIENANQNNYEEQLENYCT